MTVHEAHLLQGETRSAPKRTAPGTTLVATTRSEFGRPHVSHTIRLKTSAEGSSAVQVSRTQEARNLGTPLEWSKKPSDPTHSGYYLWLKRIVHGRYPNGFRTRRSVAPSSPSAYYPQLRWTSPQIRPEQRYPGLRRHEAMLTCDKCGSLLHQRHTEMAGEDPTAVVFSMYRSNPPETPVRFGSVRVGFCQVPPLQLPNFFQAA